MKTSIKIRLIIGSRLALSAAAVLVLAGGMTTNLPAAGRNPNPGILPPNANAYGHSYGEWGGLWWRWAFSIPFDVNPVADETGEFAAIGQEGPVWFLAGSFGVEGITRTVEVPAGKALFFPVVNSSWVTTCVGEPRTIDGIRPLIAADIDATTSMAAEIDGVPVQDLGNYRAESPLFCTSLAILGILTQEDLENSGLCGEGVEYNSDCLDLPNPEEHFGPDDGFGPAMSDGVWLMVAPLRKGDHTIRISASREGFALDVTYNLTVK